MNADTIARIFNHCFHRSHNTVLMGGADEPLYQPAKEINRVFFRADYPSSALHEAAHWLIAGSERRRQEDYGYWYVQERDADAQRAFERAETRPQALEWILSVAAAVPFRVSCDNFDETTLDLPRFRRQVQKEALAWLKRGLTPRARYFQEALTEVSGQQLNCQHFMALPQ